jgi:hypothetical protein
MKRKQALLYVALAFFLVSLVFTGFGGIVDMLRNGNGLVISREHAWNDGHYMILVAIFVLLISRCI